MAQMVPEMAIDELSWVAAGSLSARYLLGDALTQRCIERRQARDAHVRENWIAKLVKYGLWML